LLRELFRERSVSIECTSYLRSYLDEVDRFVEGAKDIRSPDTEKNRDELAILLSAKPLLMFRLAESLARLAEANTPGLTKRLRELARMPAGDADREQEFQDVEYETYCASEFTFQNERVSFVKCKKDLRYRKHVEFLVRHKFSVECKRPRRWGTVTKNVRDAVKKIVERKQPGLVAITLDHVFCVEYPFIQLLNEDDLRSATTARFLDGWVRIAHKVLESIRNTPVRAILIHYRCPSYNHSTEMIGLPTFRLALLPNGQWLGTNVIEECLRLLRNR
jgi:hypothetical protein